MPRVVYIHYPYCRVIIARSPNLSVTVRLMPYLSDVTRIHEIMPSYYYVRLPTRLATNGSMQYSSLKVTSVTRLRRNFTPVLACKM